MTKLTQSKFHFIGIGGIGMCGLAELLHNMGATVTGSDVSQNAQVERLEEMGIPITLGHDRANVGTPDVVVYSSAINRNNPEMLEAKERKIPVIRRAEALAELMHLKRGVAIGGSHGKTTTTSFTSSIFLEAKKSPTIVVGGRLDVIKSTAQLGQGQWLIAEADESDGSFQLLSPEIAVVTNIDDDHLDHYKTFENLKRAFFDFAARIPFYGAAIVCGDDSVIREVFADFPKRILYYGFESHNDFVLRGDKGRYEVTKAGEVLCTFRLNMPGKHNAKNALAALIAALEAGIALEDAVQGLETFQGVDRRFQFRGENEKFSVYDDYGHHPTEISSTLQGARERFPDRRLVVLFQPHRFSRTELCWEGFVNCFGQADVVYLTDIYAAGEKEIPDVHAERLAKEIAHGHVVYIPKDELQAQNILKDLQKGDVIITLGAGDIWKTGLGLLKDLP